MNKKILIIGGVAGGATAAARARRSDESAEITILERGNYISFANCGLPYYISREIKSRSNLILQTPESFYSRYKIQVRLHTEAIQINRYEKYVLAKTETGEEKVFYDKLILSQGANPILPDVPGVSKENAFTLRDIDDLDKKELKDLGRTSGNGEAGEPGDDFRSLCRSPQLVPTVAMKTRSIRDR